MIKLNFKKIAIPTATTIFFIIFVLVFFTYLDEPANGEIRRAVLQKTTVRSNLTDIAAENANETENIDLSGPSVLIDSEGDMMSDLTAADMTLNPEDTQTKKPDPSSTPLIVNTVANKNKKFTIKIPQLAIRNYDSTEYSVLGYINYGESFTSQGITAAGWHKVTCGGITGYIDGAYITDYPVKTTATVTDTPMLKYITPTPAATTETVTDPKIAETQQSAQMGTTGINTQTAGASGVQGPEYTSGAQKPGTPSAISSSAVTAATAPAATTSSAGKTISLISFMNPPSLFKPLSTATAAPTQTFLKNTISGKMVKYSQTNYVDPYIPYTYTQMLKDIENVTGYYNFLEKGEIGKSNLDRSIPYIKLGKGPKKIFICGAMHAREYLSTSYIMKIIETYSYYYANDMTYGTFRVKRLLDTYSLWFVPMVNPDGVTIVNEPQTVDLTQLASFVGNDWTTPDVMQKWKANGRGVDINNNFNCDWADMNLKTTFPAYMSYKGPAAESEPETKAVESFCRQNRFDAAVSLHTKGEVVYWDDSVTTGKIPKNQYFTDAICNLTGYVRIPTTTSVNEYGGGFENWFRKEFLKPGLCVELTPGIGGENPHDPKNFDSFVWQNTKYLPLIAIQSLL